MLWTARAGATALGVLAWVGSYYLAYVGLGSSAPKWLLPGIVVFGAIFIIASGIALHGDYVIDHERRADRQSDLLDGTYKLLHAVNDRLAPVQALKAKIIAFTRIAKEEGKLDYTGAPEDRLSRGRKFKVESEYRRVYRTEAYLLLRRLKKYGILPKTVTLDAVQRGWFQDIEALVTDLSAIAQELDA